MFSTFEYLSDPLPFTIPAPRTIASINPFPTTTLPSPLTPTPHPRTTVYFQPRAIPTPPPAPSRPTPPYHHHGLTSLRARAFPTHFPSAPTKSLSLSYAKDFHWHSHPLVEAPSIHLYRQGTAKGWKATTTASGLFSDERGGVGEEEGKRGKEVKGGRGVSGRKERVGVAHGEPWRGSGSKRVVGDRAQLGGGVEVYRLSPFERTEPVRAKLLENGMRSGYRVSGITQSCR